MPADIFGPPFLPPFSVRVVFSMPLDPVRLEDTVRWMARAASDLRSARHALVAEPPILDDAVFHCQQAAEKALKGFLCWHDVVFRKTHNLEEIGEQCLAVDDTLRPAVDTAVPLTQYAWQYRYPGDEIAPSQEEVSDAIRSATGLFDAILRVLPPDVTQELTNRKAGGA